MRELLLWVDRKSQKCTGLFRQVCLLCLLPICLQVVVIACISFAVNWIVSMASYKYWSLVSRVFIVSFGLLTVGEATPPPHMILIKSAPPLSSSRVAFKTSGTPSQVRLRNVGFPPQHSVGCWTDNPKSPCPPRGIIERYSILLMSLITCLGQSFSTLIESRPQDQSLFDGVHKNFACAT